MIAIIKTGGKQYIVQEGDLLKVEVLSGKAGDAVEFDVLLRADENGSTVDLGAPMLSPSVKGEIVEHGRAQKVSVVKYKPKVRYTRRVGHRQPWTKVKITKI